MSTPLQSFKKFIQDNIFPPDYTCNLCGIEVFGTELCADCLKKMTFNNGATCTVCGRRIPASGVCIECKAAPPEFKRAYSAFVYSDGAAQLITQFKNGKPYLAVYLARYMEKSLKELDADCIVCVPMTTKVLKKRGYNQSELLAKELAELTGLPVLTDAALKVHSTSEQKYLSREDRSKNLRGCFKADKALVKDRRILVVDDVMTTGSTLNELCKTLKRAGAVEVYAVTAASVEYPVLP